MDPVTVTLAANLLIALMVNMPQIIDAINKLNIPDEDKASLLARIKAAQANLPVWE